MDGGRAPSRRFRRVDRALDHEPWAQATGLPLQPFRSHLRVLVRWAERNDHSVSAPDNALEVPLLFIDERHATAVPLKLVTSLRARLADRARGMSVIAAMNLAIVSVAELRGTASNAGTEGDEIRARQCRGRHGRYGIGGLPAATLVGR